MAEKVLLVDTSQTIRALARLSLAGDAHELLTASDSQEAQEIFRRERPTVVVADAMLKHLDGYQLCRVLRQQQPGLRFVLMTPEYLPLDEALAAEVGVGSMLVKPFERQSLLAAIAGKAPAVSHPSTSSKSVAVQATGELRDEVERAVAERLPALLETLVPRIAKELRAVVRDEVRSALPDVVAKALPKLDAQMKALVEPVVWKSVPPLAEELIKEEIARLTEGLEES